MLSGGLKRKRAGGVLLARGSDAFTGVSRPIPAAAASQGVWPTERAPRGVIAIGEGKGEARGCPALAGADQSADIAQQLTPHVFVDDGGGCQYSVRVNSGFSYLLRRNLISCGTVWHVEQSRDSSYQLP